MNFKEIVKLTVLPLAFAASVVLAMSAHATGTINVNAAQLTPSNPSQFGTLYPQATNGTAGAGYPLTNSFPYPFNAPPALVVTTPSGNSVTNGTITSTNFIVTSSTTNTSISWQAYAGYARVQTGLAAAGTTNITFAIPFTATPVVQLEGVNTNAYSLGVVSSTGFTINEPVTNGVAVYWGAFGTAYTAGQNIVTY